MSARRLAVAGVLRRSIAVVAVSLLAACASDSPRKAAELPALEASADLRLRWQVDTGDSGHAVLQPAVAGDAVFIAAADGSVGRYQDGRAVWTVKLRRPLSGGAATDGKLVVVGTAKGEVIALAAADGKEAWRARVSSEVLAPAAFSGGRVLVRSGDHRLFALDSRDGTRQWVMQRTPPPLTLRVTAAPVVAENLVFVGYPGGRLLAVNVTNGAVLWEGSVALPKGANELERMADVAGVPVLGPREVCAVAYQGRVACFDLTSGNLIWAQDVSAGGGVAMDSASVYVSDDEGIVRAYARADGKVLWTQEALKWRRLGTPLVRRGFLLIGDGDGVLHVLQRADGRLAARLVTSAGALLGDGVIAGDTTLYQSRLGGVLAIDVD